MKIEGYGRFGLSYYQNGYTAYTTKNQALGNVSDNSKTWMEQRLRMNPINPAQTAANKQSIDIAYSIKATQ